MGDDTKELLRAHQEAILRELDRLHTNVSDRFDGMKHDMSGIRSKMDQHAHDDNTRFGAIDSSLSGLRVAYGVGVFVIVAILAALKVIQ